MAAGKDAHSHFQLAFFALCDTSHVAGLSSRYSIHVRFRHQTGRSHRPECVLFNDLVVLAKGYIAEAKKPFSVMQPIINISLTAGLRHTGKLDLAVFHHCLLGSINIINATTQALNRGNLNVSSVLITLCPN